MAEETIGHTTKEETIEAWNTWKGRYKDIEPQVFCKSNPCNAGSQVVDKYGRYIPLDNEDVIQNNGRCKGVTKWISLA